MSDVGECFSPLTVRIVTYFRNFPALNYESGGPACARNGAAPAGPPDTFPER